MSYEIEYSKKAYRSTDKYGNEAFVTYVTTCSNNVDPRTPRPMFFWAGQRWEIIKRACDFAGDCESGVWKPKNRWVSPESYIRNWRKVLRNALSLEVLHGRLRFKLTMKHEAFRAYLKSEPNLGMEYQWGRVKELIVGLTMEDFRRYDQDYTSVEIPVKSYADVERAVELNEHLKKIGVLGWNMEIIP